MKKKQLGGTILGFILGVIVGLGAALAVAVYVTKVPVPFLNKGAARGADQDAVEVGKDLGVREGQAITYARGRSREAMVATSSNIRSYRNARREDPAAMVPEFTTAQRDELASDHTTRR